MAEPEIQVLSNKTEERKRTFQLAPIPSDQWWATFDRTLERWLREVARLPPNVDLYASSPRDIVAQGVSEDNSRELDHCIANLVQAVNRARPRPD